MPAASDGANDAPSSPHEIVLELLRATDTSNPFAFELQEQSYVRRLDTGAGRSASFPWRAEVLEHLASIQKESASPTAAAWLGEETRAFLDRLGWTCDEEGIRGALDVGRPVHLTLRLGAAELYALPWEFVPLGATGRPLGSLSGVFLRYEWPDTETARPEPDPPPEGGRIVFAWSAAGGGVPAAEHLAAIRDACNEGHHPGFDPARDVVPHASLKAIRQALRTAPAAVLHLLCHGGSLHHDSEAYGLVLESDDGTGKEIVDARALQLALADHMGSLRLVVLCACHGGNPGTLDSRLGSVAQALHRAGIPAIVASRYPLSVDASILLTEQLYQGLLVQVQSLSAAFIAARARLRECAARAGWGSLQLYARAADGPDYRPIVHRPYRGLLTFQSAHARYFHGREAEIEEALQDLSALAAANDPARPRFLICTGASGAGKSSLVLAGVLPALRRRDAAWAAALMRPNAEWRAQLETLASRRRSGVPTLLVVDQFEEVFTMVAGGEREALVHALWRLAGDPDSGVSVIVTLRVDFLARCGEISLGFGDRLLEDVAYDGAHRIFIPRMKAEHLRKTIVQPAEQVGIVLETGLIEQLLKDAGDEPGALPLLQYTLDQLWQHRRGRQLTWEQYNHLGGVGGALEKQADEILRRFDDVQRRAARRLFVQLVEFDDDARLDRRRRVPVDRLRRGPEAQAAVFLDVMNAFVHERLLVLSRGGGAAPAGGSGQAGFDVQSTGHSEGESSIVEVAHEQLIRSWGTLRVWIQEDRQMCAELQRLDRWVEEARRYVRYVLDSDRLGHARELRKRYPDDINDITLALIQRSEDAARAKRLANIGMTIAATLAALAMGVLAIWALHQEDKAQAAKDMAGIAQEKAEAQAALARNARLMSNARVLLERNQPGPATKLLVAVSESEPAPGWIELAQRALEVGSPKVTFRGHRGDVISASFSPDGKRVVTASLDGTARVWNVDGTGDPVVIGDHGSEVLSAAFTPDGEHIKTIARNGVVRVWKDDEQGSPDVLDQRAQLLSIAFGPNRQATYVSSSSSDGKRLVTLTGDSAQVKNTDGSGAAVALKGQRGKLLAATFSPDGRRIVTTSSDGSAWVWSTDGTGEPIVFLGHEDAVLTAAFSPDGQRVVTASYDLTARVWSIDHATKPVVLKGHVGPLTSVAFSPDGQRIVTSSQDKTVRIWNADGSGRSFILRGHEDIVVSAEFSPDGSHIVTASSDGTARLWSTSEPHASVVIRGAASPQWCDRFSRDGTRLLVSSKAAQGGTDIWNMHESGKFAVAQSRAPTMPPMAISPDGYSLMAARADNAAEIWNADGSGVPVTLRGHTGLVIYGTFSRDGRRVVTASADMTARIWNADGSGTPIVLRGHRGPVRLASFSADGSKVVTTSADNTARVWNADGAGDPTVLRGFAGQVRLAAFSPDGTRVLTIDEVMRSKPGAEPVTRARSKPGTGNKTRRGQDLQGLWPAAIDDGATHSTSVAKPSSITVLERASLNARVWNTDGLGEPLVLQGHGADGSPAAFSHDGEYVVTTSGNAAYMRRVDGTGSVDVFQHDEAEVSSVVFSPDGRHLAGALPDRQSVVVWNVDGSGVPLVLRSASPDFRPSSVAFSPDSKRVAAFMQEGDLIQIWVIAPDLLRRMLHHATNDCLLPQTRQSYLDEAELDARSEYESCERAHGRHPFYSHALEEQRRVEPEKSSVTAGASEYLRSQMVHPVAASGAVTPPAPSASAPPAPPSKLPSVSGAVPAPPTSSSVPTPALPPSSSRPPGVLKLPPKTPAVVSSNPSDSSSGSPTEKTPGKRPPAIRIPDKRVSSHPVDASPGSSTEKTPGKRIPTIRIPGKR